MDGAQAADPQMCVDLSAAAPLQITVTRASLELIKSLADVSHDHSSRLFAKLQNVYTFTMPAVPESKCSMLHVCQCNMLTLFGQQKSWIHVYFVTILLTFSDLRLISNAYKLVPCPASIILISCIPGVCWFIQAYAKEYGKQVEGSVKVNSLTGAPFTIFNMVIHIRLHTFWLVLTEAYFLQWICFI